MISNRAVLRSARSFSIAAVIAHAAVTALRRRQGEEIVKCAELGADLFGEILLGANELGEARILGDGARLNLPAPFRDGAAAHGIGQRKRFDRDIVRHIWGTQQHADVGFEQLPAGRSRPQRSRRRRPRSRAAASMMGIEALNSRTASASGLAARA